MKKSVCIICIGFLCLLTLGFQGAGAKFKFEDTKHNFGFIRQGEVVTFEFFFENDGIDPLVISQAKTECSCTKVVFPSKPIKGGERSSVKVTYDSKGAIDRQDRTVTLFSNATNSPFILRFKGVVLKKKD